MKINVLAQIKRSLLSTYILAGAGLILPLSVAYATMPTSSTAPAVRPTVTSLCKIVRINTSSLVYEPIPASNSQVQQTWFCPAGYVPIGVQVRDIDPTWVHGTEYYDKRYSPTPPLFDYIELRGNGSVIGTGGSWAITNTYFAGLTDQTYVPPQYQVNYAVVNGNALPGKERPNRTGLICAKREIVFVKQSTGQCFNN